MAVYSDDAVFQFVGTATRATNTTIPTLPNGAVGIFDESGTAVTSALSSVPTQKVQVIKRKADGTLLKSPWFAFVEILSKSKGTYMPPIEQVSYIGATNDTAVSGLGTITVSNTYSIDIAITSAQADIGSSPFIKTLAALAASGDNQKSLALSLIQSGQRVLTRNMPFPTIRMERVTSAALTLVTGTGYVNWAVINGSNVATSSAVHGLTIGTSYVLSLGGSSYIATPTTTTIVTLDVPWMNITGTVIGGGLTTPATASVTNGSTAVTMSAAHGVTVGGAVIIDIAGIQYTGVSAAATTLTLSFPYQTVTAAAAAITATGYATPASEFWGLKFTGIAQPFDAINGRYHKVRFFLTPNVQVNSVINPYTGSPYAYALGFDATVVATTLSNAFSGSGVAAQVAEQEILTQLQNTNYTLQAYPRKNYIQETNMTATYVITNIQLTKNLLGNNINVVIPTTVTIAIAVDSTLTTNDNTVLGTVFTV